MLKYSNFRFPYQYFHLTFELNVYPHFKDLDWAFVCHNLKKCQLRWPDVEFHALTMMDTHVHLLFRIAPRYENFFAQDLLERMGQKSPINIIVEPIRSYSQYLDTYKMIYNNPLKAKLCDSCEDYRYSSLYGILGRSIQYLNMTDTVGLIQHPQKILTWLNTGGNYKNSVLKTLRQDNSFSM